MFSTNVRISFTEIEKRNQYNEDNDENIKYIN